jgi:prophage regulatory protein
LAHPQAAARAAAPDAAYPAYPSPAWRDAPDFLDGVKLEVLTGTKAATWRYWAFLDRHADPDNPDAPRLCPPSFKIGRRRVWKKEVVLQWLAEQEKAASAVSA